MSRTSRLPGFYRLPLAERREVLARLAGIEAVAGLLADGSLLAPGTADRMIENVVGIHGLPLGLCLNLQVNGRDHLVPMAVEEPSVVAAASNAAKMVRAGGGFEAESDEPIMIAQVQLTGVADTDRGRAALIEATPALLAAADEARTGLVCVGGGARGLEVRVLEAAQPGQPGMLVVHLLVDCRNAMGANSVNTMAEALAPRLAALAGGTVGLRVLSNLADRRCVRVRCRVPVGALVGPGAPDGAGVARGVAAASHFADIDPYRAATHNKGIMNGIDPVVVATGNDWRGIEAGAHAFAARTGAYRPLSAWGLDDEAAPAFLLGRMELPMALGTVGGATRVHPGACLALAILEVGSAAELGMVAAAVGLASNLAALRALATEGIQRGHMELQARAKSGR